MISLKYGYVVEDEAQAIFLENILPQMLSFLKESSNFSFEKDERYFTSALLFVASNRTKLDETYVNLAELGLIDYQQDVFFIARDIDHKDFNKLIEKFDEILNNIKNKGLTNEKIIIALPIQCLEYWLRFEKLNRNPQDSTLPQGIDNQRKRTIKQNIYGTSCPTDRRKQIVKDLSQNVDISFLATHSKSFEHFFNQLQDFLNRLK